MNNFNELKEEVYTLTSRYPLTINPCVDRIFHRRKKNKNPKTLENRLIKRRKKNKQASKSRNKNRNK